MRIQQCDAEERKSMNQMRIEWSESCLRMTKEELEGDVYGAGDPAKGRKWRARGDIKTKHLSPHGEMREPFFSMIEE